MKNPIKESGYIPSFSFLKHLYYRTGGNPEKALHYWFNRDSDYEKEHPGTVFEECAFMPDDIFEKKYRVIDTTFPGKETTSYAFLQSYALCGDIYQAKEQSGIKLKDNTLVDRLQNGWGDCIRVLKGEFTPLTKVQYENCMIVREKIRKHPLFTENIKGEYTYQKLIQGSHTFECNGQMVTQEYKGYSDVLKPNEIVVDMKTTNNLDKFYRQGKPALYHAQLAMYGDAEGCDRYAFFALEATPPFSCNVFWLEEDILNEGREVYKSMLESFYKVNTENRWHEGDEFYYPNGRYFEWEK